MIFFIWTATHLISVRFKISVRKSVPKTTSVQGHLRKIVSYFSGETNRVRLTCTPFQMNNTPLVLSFHLSVFKARSAETSKQRLLGQDYPLFPNSAGPNIIHLSSEDMRFFFSIPNIGAVFFLFLSLPRSYPFLPSANLLQSNEKCVQYPRDRPIMTGKQ